MVERNGNVKAKVVNNVKARTLKSLVRKNIDLENSTLITDEFKGYARLSAIIDHKRVNHKIWYVDGQKHTNTIESFWAILKRGIVGQYHKVSLRYIPFYIDEFCFRYNNRKKDNIFDLTIKQALGA